MTLQDPTGPLAVPFDDVSACGVRVEPRPARAAGRRAFVTVQVVTRHGDDDPHDLTMAQAEQLRDALAAIL
mgnify:FL=1